MFNQKFQVGDIIVHIATGDSFVVTKKDDENQQYTIEHLHKTRIIDFDGDADAYFGFSAEPDNSIQDDASRHPWMTPEKLGPRLSDPRGEWFAWAMEFSDFLNWLEEKLDNFYFSKMMEDWEAEKNKNQ